MKRLVPLLAVFSLFLSLPAYAKNLYIENKSDDDFNYLTDGVIKNLSDSAKSLGFDLVDYGSLDLVPYGYYWGEYEKLPLESERLEEEKKRLEETLGQYSRFRGMTVTLIDGDAPEEKIAELEKKIEAAKEREKKMIEPSTCYPRVSFKFYVEDIFGGLYDDITMTLYRNPEESFSFDVYFTDSFFRDKEAKVDLCAKCIESFFPHIKGELNKDQSQNILPPEIIDRHTMTELGGTRSANSISIAIRDDFSFVMRAKDSIIDYSPTWEARENLTKKINGSSNFSTYWETVCADGKNVLFANQGTPSVISLNEKNSVSGKTQYKYPSSNSILRFFKSGKPYLVDQMNAKIYLPQKNGSLREMRIPMPRVTSTIAAPGERICFQYDNAVYVFDTESFKLEKVIAIDSDSNEITCKTLDDFSFITVNQNRKTASRFSADGKRLWTFNLDESLKYSICCSTGKGIYFFYDSVSNILWRLAESDAELPPVVAALRDSGKSQGATLSQTAEIYKRNADTLYAAQSYQSALDNYSKYLEICPNDTDAADKRLACEVSVNKKAAAEKTEEALDLFDEYGEETARPAYQEAMKLLERLRKQVPWDEEVQEAYSDLKNAFSPEEGFSTADIPSLSVEAFDLASLFPVLMNVYASNPAGYITVKNNGSGTIKNLSVTSYVRKYMDFPSKGGEVKELKPGSQADIEINTVLNKKVLQVEENTVLQMQFTLSWEEDGKAKSLVITRPVTLYKKSAMTWADTAMLSCFIQPNDPNVSKFVFKALSQNKTEVLSANVTKALVLANAVGSIPLTYVSDPSAPLSQLIDNEYSVDTVRFPAETLSLRGGDCDDMTTLLCSLLESAGIPSALITTPGHIFAAFDTGLKKSPAWEKLENEYRTITIDGNVWIPVESTVLEKGFEAAWKSASKEIAKNDYECTQLKDAWELYSSAANPEGQKEVSLSAEKLSSMNKKSFGEVKAQISLALQKAGGGSPSELNSLARLWYSIGEKEEAAKVLSSITETSPQYLPAYRNLEAIYTELGKLDEAARVGDRARKVSGKAADKSKAEDKSRAKNSALEWED